MRKIIVVFLILFSLSAVAQDHGQAKKIKGVPVYVMSEPLRPYYQVMKISAFPELILWECPEFDDVINILVDKALKKERKEKIEVFDAIIVNMSTFDAIIIKYTE